MKDFGLQIYTLRNTMDTAKKCGVKYYVVEQDTCPGDPFDSVKMSADFLKKM